MSEFVKTIKGKVVGYGKHSKEGFYDVYEYLEVKTADGTVEVVKNVAANPNLNNEIGNAVAFKFADAKNFNSHYKYNYLCGLQKKNGDVLTDDRMLKTVYKARYAIAYLSLIPPFTIISPFVFSKAKKLKQAYEELGQFDPLEPSFVNPTKRKRF